MRRWRVLPWAAPIGAAVATMIATQTVALAYPPPASSAKLVSGCTTLTVGSSCTYTFQFFDSGGNGVSGLLVALGLDALPGCTITPANSTTSGGGTVSSTYSCDRNAGTGTEIITASSGDVSTSVSVAVVAASSGNGSGTSLPFTATGAPGTSPWLIAGLALAAVAVAGGGVYLSRSRRGRPA